MTARLGTQVVVLLWLVLACDQALGASAEAMAERRKLRLLFTVVPMVWRRYTALAGAVRLGRAEFDAQCAAGGWREIAGVVAFLRCGAGPGWAGQWALRKALGVWPQWFAKRLLKCDAVAKPSSVAMSAMVLRL